MRLVLVGDPGGWFTCVLERLAEDLIGPLPGNPVLTDFPADVFVTGILYPPREPDDDRTDTETAEPVEGPGTESASAETSGPPDEPISRRHPPVRPSAAGLSFALKTEEGLPAEIEVEITGARYVPEETEDTSALRWHRTPVRCHCRELDIAQHTVPLGDGAFANFELRIVAAPMVGEGPSGRHLVTVVLYNKGPVPVKGEGANTARIALSAHALFETRLVVRPGEGSRLIPRLHPRNLPDHTDEDERAAHLLWRDVQEYATGHTCAAHWQVGADVTCPQVETAWLPASLVPATSGDGAAPFRSVNPPGAGVYDAARLAEADDVLDRLDALVAAYRSWIDTTRADAKALTGEHATQATRHLDQCAHVARRMDGGVATLRKTPELLTAFRLANRAMALQWTWKAGGPLAWRPFQLGFVLLALASCADATHEDRTVMDLVWFPTGGGKTEAYLLLTAFTIFSRRLREGPERGHGVTAIMRYTLRLLTVQQFERAAAMICAADLVRRATPGLADGPPISLGLWLGSAMTPNRLAEAESVLSRTGREGDADPAQLTRCPSCGSDLRWQVSDQTMTVRCTNAEPCELSGAPLPIHTVDEELYRVRPSLVIATADKFAQIARQPSTSALFGLALEGGVTVDPPDLIIQDELHLISGPLGTLAGLYESAIDYLCARDGQPVKVIGSTATIRRASDQVSCLFARTALQFPPPGIDTNDTGFAVEDYGRPGRLYVGVTTAGRSKPAILTAVCASLLQSGGDFHLSSEERDAIYTLVGYFNSLRELGSSVSLMQVGVGETMERLAGARSEQVRDIDNQIEITSRVSSRGIGAVLRQLEARADHPEAVDVALATNMISVGVDVDRLGLLVVDGQPKGVAEYIQATSRVGRGRTPGLVVGLFNAHRTRDRSRYETHRSWHQALYRDVEPTAVTPFAPRARDRALHAPFAALAAHGAPELWADPAHAHHLAGYLQTVRDILVARAVRVEPGEADAVERELNALIGQWTDRLPTEWWSDREDDALLMAAEHAAQRAAAGRTAKSPWPTPNSLRCVEATVNIELVGQ